MSEGLRPRAMRHVNVVSYQCSTLVPDCMKVHNHYMHTTAAALHAGHAVISIPDEA